MYYRKSEVQKKKHQFERYLQWYCFRLVNFVNESGVPCLAPAHCDNPLSKYTFCSNTYHKMLRV